MDSEMKRATKLEWVRLKVVCKKWGTTINNPCSKDKCDYQVAL